MAFLLGPMVILTGVFSLTVLGFIVIKGDLTDGATGLGLKSQVSGLAQRLLMQACFLCPGPPYLIMSSQNSQFRQFFALHSYK